MSKYEVKTPICYKGRRYEVGSTIELTKEEFFSIGAVHFFEKEVDKVVEQKADEKVEEKKVNPLECPYCGRICKNKVGFSSHVRNCKKKVR